MDSPNSTQRNRLFCPLDAPYPPQLIECLYDGMKPLVLVYVSENGNELLVTDGIDCTRWTSKDYNEFGAFASYDAEFAGLGRRAALFDRKSETISVGSLSDVDEMKKYLLETQWTSALSPTTIRTSIAMYKCLETWFRTSSMIQQQKDMRNTRLKFYFDWLDDVTQTQWAAEKCQEE